MPITRCGLAALTALCLAGCASPPPMAPPPLADDSPLQATAVVDALVTSQGIAGFFPFEGTSLSYTRADMRREENSFKAMGTLSRFVLGNSADANIVRLDRKLVYRLDAKRAEYTECPISGCVTPGPQKEPTPAQQPEQPRASRDEGCKMRVASNTFDVKATGAKRAINGFDTEQHTATWTVILEDGSKRRSTSLLNAEFWTTAPTPAMRQAQAIELAYARTTVSEVRKLMPDQVQRAMSVFLQDSLSATDKAALFNLSKQFEKIRGQPILTTMRWGYSGEACGGVATDGGAPAGGIAGLIGGLAGGKIGGSNNNSKEPAPLISMSHEVRRYGVEPVRDSQFVPPPNYRRANP
jgi:hypothetical protein